jgi:hypothetical protein
MLTRRPGKDDTMKTMETLDKFAFRLVAWNGAPPQINVVCKRCLGCLYQGRYLDQMWMMVEGHDCSHAKVANFMGIPESL